MSNPEFNPNNVPIQIAADYLREHWTPDPSARLFFSDHNGYPWTDSDVMKAACLPYYLGEVEQIVQLPLYTERMAAILLELGVNLFLQKERVMYDYRAGSFRLVNWQ